MSAHADKCQAKGSGGGGTYYGQLAGPIGSKNREYESIRLLYA